MRKVSNRQKRILFFIWTGHTVGTQTPYDKSSFQVLSFRGIHAPKTTIEALISKGLVYLEEIEAGYLFETVRGYNAYKPLTVCRIDTAVLNLPRYEHIKAHLVRVSEKTEQTKGVC